MKSTSNVIFPSWRGKFVNPNFRHYQSDRNNEFNCYLKIQSKMAVRVSICTLNPFKYLHSKFISDVPFPSLPGKFVNPNFRQYQSDRNNGKFNCCLEIQPKMAAIVSICTLKALKLFSQQIHV